MTFRAVLRAYGLWLLGVLSAAAAAYFLHRSRVISYELSDDLTGGNGAGDEYELEGLPERLADYT